MGSKGIGVVVHKLASGHDLPPMWEHPNMEDSKIDFLHGIHIIASQENVAINLCIGHLDIDRDSLTYKFYENILQNPLWF